MASRIADATGSRVIGSHLPLNVILSAIPSLPRPVLSRLVSRMIDRLDQIDGDPDLEDSEAAGSPIDERGRPLLGLRFRIGDLEDDEDDDPPEEDDPSGGNVEDEGEAEDSL